ncbi:MAG TPA: CHAT domain-containing tetratricopeptide repeat protein [Candidatus Sulfotelmatobacter sp.]|jgi:CHAT domain-containing protein|nr:CHAT domain-containing tetratricopeptide repeat protein [Candidatus Sulfotelmatobacter sp.]
MPVARAKNSTETLVAELGQLTSDAARRIFLSKHKKLVRQATIEQLAQLVVQRVRVSAKEALSLAEAAILIAKRLRRKQAHALALRAMANALYSNGDYRAAIEHHQRAIQLYESMRAWKELARTLSSSIQPMILVGEYDQAFRAVERAREIFARLGDRWRLARLEINAGNIYHRQDRFEESIASYEDAYRNLMPYKDAEGIAVVLSNMAVCLISLNDFPRALATYQRARAFCHENNMPLLVAQADYNIAYLYYLRGEYSHAIEALYAARRACESTGDAYHFALCHLDLSDIYLELNLSEEAREMAHEGFLRFEKLGMGYEAAKTLANEATAYAQQGKTVQALERFTKAREMFGREKNLVWPWLIDLYQGLLLFHEGRYFESRRLCAAAADFFDSSALQGKAVLAHLLLARIALQVGDPAEAQKETEESLARLAQLQTPVLAYQAHLLQGQLAQARNDRLAALRAFLDAKDSLETMRSRLHGEELKISFLKNRMQVYESLLDLFISGDGSDASPEDALSWMEAAKSRSMIEMIFQSGQSLPLGETGQSDLVRRIRDLREELNWYYHRIELEQLRPEEKSVERLDTLQKKAQSHEKELLRTLRELPARDRESTTLEAPADLSAAKLQSALPPGTTLLEYFSAGDSLIAAIITREEIRILPVTVLARVTHILQLLRFQLSKFRMGSEYVRRFEEPLLRATQSHLESLYVELIAPLRQYCHGDRLVIVPHGPLHFLPFHALRNGEEYLCDSFRISYAPSASVFFACQEKPAGANTGSLVFGIADERAPQILQEAESVAALLPQSSLRIGRDATSSLLREQGPQTGLLHIATHGVYRQDNPMFSGIRLGDGYLNLFDLYQMRLNANLVTLSGCATGMNFVAAGDELLGLQRGLFYAGASTLLLSLWDVHDQSTSQLMQFFYNEYLRTGETSGALQHAMQQLRQQNPHPYFWAPFALVGKLTDSTELN